MGAHLLAPLVSSTPLGRVSPLVFPTLNPAAVFLRSACATSARGIPYRGGTLGFVGAVVSRAPALERCMHHRWLGARSPYKDVHPIVERLEFWVELAHKAICGSGFCPTGK